MIVTAACVTGVVLALAILLPILMTQNKSKYVGRFTNILYFVLLIFDRMVSVPSTVRKRFLTIFDPAPVQLQFSCNRQTLSKKTGPFKVYHIL